MHRSYEQYVGGNLRGVGTCTIIGEIRRDGSDRMDGVLASSVHFDVTEPKDKVFGLLGLTSRRTHQDAKTPSDPISSTWVRPNYSTSTAAIYTEATKAAITSYNRLNVLRLPELNSDFGEVRGIVPDCPSWVPQFNAVPAIKSKGIRNFSPKGCDNSMSLVLDKSTTAEILRVQGITVTGLTSVLGIFTPDILDDISKLSDFIYNIWLSVRTDTSASGSLEMLFRIMTMQNGDLLEHTDSDHYCNLRSSFFSLLQECRTFRHGSDFSHWPEYKILLGVSSSAYIDHLRTVVLYKSFFSTRDGQVGSGPSNAQRGDEVAIIFGYGIPFLLRPRGSVWNLVGRVYLHVIMDVSRDWMIGFTDTECLNREATFESSKVLTRLAPLLSG